MIGMSLRAISRKLGYSVSSLHGHQKRGRFEPLSDGSYDLGDVVDGLLAWSEPSLKHRSALDANKRTKSVQPKAKPLTTEQQAAEDAAVAATMALLNSKETQAAVRLLATLPRRMLEVSQKIDPVPYPQHTLSGFKLSVVEWLANNIKAAR
jgi:hypothetical protein